MENYNSDKSSQFIQYLDANNLYGWAMSQSLPTRGFKWLKDGHLTNENVLELLEKKITNHGYISEVDIEYPKSYGNYIMITLLHLRH